MPSHKQEYLSEFSIDKIYALIIDIESYPEFLPWCSAARIIEESEQVIIADLVITFKAFTEHYRSEVTKMPPEHKKASVKVKMLSGPFEYLNNNWELEEKDGKTLIKFYIDFAFKSVVLEKIIGIVFNKACEKMLSAFADRAKDLYRKQDERK